MNMVSRVIVIVLFLSVWAPSFAQSYPSKPIRLIVPVPPVDVPALGEGVGVGAETGQ
jgi:hypothetical protein